MKVAKFINKYSIEVLEFESTQKKIEASYQDDLTFNGVTDAVIDVIKRKQERSESITEAEKNLLKIREQVDSVRNYQNNTLNNYKTLVNAPPPAISDMDEIVPFYNERASSIEQVWEINSNVPSKVRAKVEELKNSLASTDYIIIKYYESLTTGATPPPPDSNVLLSRQSQRNEINRLESLLS